jgi:hypothetical protein
MPLSVPTVVLDRESAFHWTPWNETSITLCNNGWWPLLDIFHTWHEVPIRSCSNVCWSYLGKLYREHCLILQADGTGPQSKEWTSLSIYTIFRQLTAKLFYYCYMFWLKTTAIFRELQVFKTCTACYAGCHWFTTACFAIHHNNNGFETRGPKILKNYKRFQKCANINTSLLTIKQEGLGTTRNLLGLVHKLFLPYCAPFLSRE